MTYRLGLDLGTNSIGWAILDIGKPSFPLLVDMGVRIFSDGREPAGEGRIGEPKAVARRMARLARRQRDRRKRRQMRMIGLLVRQGYLPCTREERKIWLHGQSRDGKTAIPSRHLAHSVQIRLARILGRELPSAKQGKESFDPLNPYWLRAEALNRRLEKYELGRVLMHLALRRGFKSNRKADRRSPADEAETGSNLVKIKELEKILKVSGARTLGEYEWRRFVKGESVRFRPEGTEIYPSRAMYLDEFDTIQKKQERYHRDFPWNRAREIISFQRPLKSQPRGFCPYYPGEARGFLAIPSMQRFRIWQDINNLAYFDGRGAKVTLSTEEKAKLYKKLNKVKKATFDGIRRLLEVDDDIRFNLEDERRSYLKGNVTSVDMRSKEAFGAEWDALTLERQDEIVQNLIELEDEEQLAQFLNKCGLSVLQARFVAGIPLETGVGSVSVRFARECAEVMEREYIRYDEAVKKLGFDHSNFRKITLRPALPYYGEILRESTMGGDPSAPEEQPEKRFGKISNPSVHVALNQLRKVVNCLLDRYGKPQEVVVELGRELKLSRRRAEELIREQTKNTKENHRIEEDIRGLGVVAPTREDRLKYRLWQELGTDSFARACVYCGKTISATDLFDGTVEVEHILPYARTLLDGPSNLTVSHKRCNNVKGNRTPFEAFCGNPSGYSYEEIMRRVNRVFRHNPRKREKFAEHSMDGVCDLPGFLQRQATDNAFIARAAKRYLQAICSGDNIWVTNGRLTYEARRAWGIDTLLTRKSAIREGALKNRLDHRHHALDALVIALMSRSIIQETARRSAREQKIIFPELPLKRADIESQLKTMLVSYRPQHAVPGKLFDETALGSRLNADGIEEWVTRKPVTLLSENDIARIVDPRVQKAIQVFRERSPDKKLVEVLQSFSKETGIRRIRIKPKDQKPIRIPSAPYKAYNPADVLFCEIWRTPGKGDRKPTYKGIYWTRFEAIRGEKLEKEERHPAAKRLMRLYKADILRLSWDDKVTYLRVAGFATKQQKIDLRPLHCGDDKAKTWMEQTPSNVVLPWPLAVAIRDGQIHISINSIFQGFDAKLIHITPDGRINDRY